MTRALSLFRSRRRFVAGVGLSSCLAVWVAAGCERGPVAPELRDSPVYYNAREGMRFLVPDGWTQSASANLPAGDFENELFLVRYGVTSADGDAQAQVLCFQDRGGNTDLIKYHSQPAFGIETWTLKEGPTEATISGQNGTWVYFTGKVKGREMGKEVLCFRRKDRVYSFVGTFWTVDQKSRQAMHRAFESVIWK
jgi:hypothetical protein